MASITMASFPSGLAVADRPAKLVVAKASSRSTDQVGEVQVQMTKCNTTHDQKKNMKNEIMSSNGRREMVFAAVAAAACSIMGGSAFADELKRGTPEAKKVYAPICVTMPTARICHK